MTYKPREPKAKGSLEFAFMEIGLMDYGIKYFTSSDRKQIIREKLRIAKDIGCHTVVLQAVEEYKHVYYDSQVHIRTPSYKTTNWSKKVGFQALEVILSEADKLNIDIIVGTGRNGDKELMKHLFYAYSKELDKFPTIYERWVENVRLTLLRIEEIHDKFKHYNSLAGFYLSHETSRFRATANRYYNQAAKRAHELNKNYIVMASPSLIYNDELPFHGQMLPKLELDVLAYQDRVGAGIFLDGNRLIKSHNPLKAINNKYEYFKGLQALHNEHTPEMWINCECWRQDKKDSDDDKEKPSYPTSFQYFKKQLSLSQQFGPIGTYEITSMLTRPGDIQFIENAKGIDRYNNRALNLYRNLMNR